MKKVVLTVLALSLALSMCACGAEESTQDGSTHDASIEKNHHTEAITTPVLSEPTEEEWQQINEYARLIRKLDEYVETREIKYRDEDGQELTGTKALEQIYLEIRNADAVDQWFGTEFVYGEEFSRTRQEVLDSFTVIEDVLLMENEITTDRLGNITNEHFYRKYGYNEDGNVQWMQCGLNYYGEFSADLLIMNPVGYGLNAVYDYDSEGNVSQIQYGVMSNPGEIYEKLQVCDIVYDNAGKIAKQNIATQFDDTEVIYEYNDNGQLTNITVVGDIDTGRNNTKGEIAYTFTYDEKGNVISFEKSLSGENGKKAVAGEFYYGTNDLPEKVICTYFTGGFADAYEKQEKICTFNYDNDGHLTSMMVKDGDIIRCYDGTVRSEGIYTHLIEMEYGDYYIYNPVQ